MFLHQHFPVNMFSYNHDTTDFCQLLTKPLGLRVNAEVCTKCIDVLPTRLHRLGLGSASPG